jgi:streptomycin 6-kinase
MYGDVVLKIEGPHTERFTEMTTLRLYAGRQACTCLAIDEEIAAILLERVVPGYDLRKLPDMQEQLRIGAEVIATLPVPLSETHGLPYYGEWITTAIANTHAHYHPSAQMRTVMAAADALFRQVCPGDEPRYLLHGDLHHENMLYHHDGTWKVIDPQGVIGAPFLESARFIQNHVIDQDDAFHWDMLDDTVAYFAARLGESTYNIASAFFILHVLSTCWGYEMNYEEDRLARLIDECEGLQKYVGDI